MEELYLIDNYLEEIPNEIASLEKLKVLYLTGNNIKDIERLERLRSLEVLDLERNAIEDFSPLKNLTSLTILNVLFNSERVADISFLEKMKSLKELKISFPEGV